MLLFQKNMFITGFTGYFKKGEQMKSAFKKLPSEKHSIDIGLLFAVTLCAALSSLLIYSIVKNKLLYKIGDSYWETQLFSMAVGVVAAVIISYIDYHKLVKLWFIFAPAALLLVALTFTTLGVQRDGADGIKQKFRSLKAF